MNKNNKYKYFILIIVTVILLNSIATIATANTLSSHNKTIKVTYLVDEQGAWIAYCPNYITINYKIINNKIYISFDKNFIYKYPNCYKLLLLINNINVNNLISTNNIFILIDQYNKKQYYCSNLYQGFGKIIEQNFMIYYYITYNKNIIPLKIVLAVFPANTPGGNKVAIKPIYIVRLKAVFANSGACENRFPPLLSSIISETFLLIAVIASIRSVAWAKRRRRRRVAPDWYVDTLEYSP